MHEARKVSNGTRCTDYGPAGPAPGEARAGASLRRKTHRLGGAMTSPILVTGGTGTLGRQVVPRLRDAGCEVRVLSRRTHEAADGIEYVTGDLLKDEGIQAAVDGAGIIVHSADTAKANDDATRNLVRP